MNNDEFVEEIKEKNQIDLANSTVKDLKLMAKNLGVSTKGTKDELIKKIKDKTN